MKIYALGARIGGLVFLTHSSEEGQYPEDNLRIVQDSLFRWLKKT